MLVALAVASPRARAAEPVAYVDLSLDPQIQYPLPHRMAGHFGGQPFDGTPEQIAEFRERQRAPFPVSVVILRQVPSTGGRSGWSAVEVLLSNAGKNAVEVPIGTDPALVEAPAPGRRVIGFGVSIGPDERRNYQDVAMAASNEQRPESYRVLRPGESMVFKIPVDTRKAAAWLAAHKLARGTIAVSAWLQVIRTDAEGEYLDSVGQDVDSGNLLPWVAPAP